MGKSNLLETMSHLGGITHEQIEKFMGSFIRYEEPTTYRELAEFVADVMDQNSRLWQ